MEFPVRVNEDAKHFLRMKANESVTGTFRGKLHTFQLHWKGNANKRHPVVCIGQGCEMCKLEDKPSFRFRVNIVLKDGDKLVSKVFEQGWKLYQQLDSINKEYPLEKYLFKITRLGEGTDTTYPIMPLANGKITDEQERKISEVPLQTLDSSTDHVTNPSTLNQEVDTNFDDITF